MALTTVGITNLKPKKADYRVADGGGLYIYSGPSERVQTLAVRLPARWQPAHPFNR
jgi:hypothetical protein